MSITSDTITLFTRELLIYKKNLVPSIARAVIFPLIFILLLGSIGNIPKNVPSNGRQLRQRRRIDELHKPPRIGRVAEPD